MELDRGTLSQLATLDEDDVARTEVEEVFSNDSDVELEGIYRFPMPPGACRG